MASGLHRFSWEDMFILSVAHYMLSSLAVFNMSRVLLHLCHLPSISLMLVEIPLAVTLCVGLAGDLCVFLPLEGC